MEVADEAAIVADDREDGVSASRDDSAFDTARRNEKQVISDASVRASAVKARVLGVFRLLVDKGSDALALVVAKLAFRVRQYVLPR
jgi:hypothetical protein